MQKAVCVPGRLKDDSYMAEVFNIYREEGRMHVIMRRLFLKRVCAVKL